MRFKVKIAVMTTISKKMILGHFFNLLFVFNLNQRVAGLVGKQKPEHQIQQIPNELDFYYNRVDKNYYILWQPTNVQIHHVKSSNFQIILSKVAPLDVRQNSEIILKEKVDPFDSSENPLTRYEIILPEDFTCDDRFIYEVTVTDGLKTRIRVLRTCQSLQIEGVNALKRFWIVFSLLVSVTILIYIIYYQRIEISRKVRQSFWPDVPVADIKLDFTQSQKRTHSDSSNKSGQFHGICILCSSTNIRKCKKDHYHSMTASNRNSELLDDNTDLLGADMLARKRIKDTDLPNIPFQRIDEVRDIYDREQHTVPETEGIYGTYQGNLSSAWSDGNHSQLDPTVKLTTDHYHREER